MLYFVLLFVGKKGDPKKSHVASSGTATAVAGGDALCLLGIGRRVRWEEKSERTELEYPVGESARHSKKLGQ